MEHEMEREVVRDARKVARRSDGNFGRNSPAGSAVRQTARAWLPAVAALWLVAPGGAGVALAQEAGDASGRQATPPPADPADVESLGAIMTAVYDVISGEQGEARDWDRFLSLFIPEARLIPTGRDPQGAHGYRVMTPREFIDTSGAWMVENGFFEDEEHRVVERWAGIAHVFSSYNSYRTAADMEAGTPFQRGINSFQLMHDGERWWVVSIMWEPESPDRPIPGEYLGEDSTDGA